MRCSGVLGALVAMVAAGGAQAFMSAPSVIPCRTRAAVAAAGPLPRLVAVPTPRAQRKAVASALGVQAMAGEIVDNVAVVLLAGGVGSRMKAGKPKQFLELEGKTILRTSLDIFLGLEGVTSISVVLAEEYRDQLADVASADPRV